jgi:pimeloyl-ACP methyl ester carboxylesterase
MAPTPGILYVTMQPQPSLPASQFQDWYNNEHGPGRLRLPFCENGFRYRATDLEGPGKGLPEWMAIYDITDMAEMTKETYLRLRWTDVQSQRERDTLAQIKVDRRLFDLVGGREAKEFKRLEEVGSEGEGNVLVAVSITVVPGKEKELDKWYSEEHIEMLSKVPGWLRTRRFVTSSILDSKEPAEYLALHEYVPKNGLGGDKFKAATSTPWVKEVSTSVVQEKRRRTYDLYYTFGPGPRDLSALSNRELVPFTSTDGLTRTIPASPTSSGAIESYITTKDGVDLPFRLEGSPDPHAPCIVLSNSILVTHGIWDGFITSFLSSPQNSKYRILRYLTRGRSSACGSQPITVDTLSSDIIALLDALRVPKAAAVVGVSLGGATALAAALKYPDRVDAFVSCDTSAKSPEGNRKTWGDRIVVAEQEGAAARTGEKVVGERLAEMTARRWFVPGSYEIAELVPELERVKDMVRTNSLEGFRKSVQALWEYDLTPLMKAAKVRGCFVVGSGDGVLPGVMKKMADGYGEKGAEYVVVEGAGHLPMVEKPKEFADAVTRFLG